MVTPRPVRPNRPSRVTTIAGWALAAAAGVALGILHPGSRAFGDDSREMSSLGA